MRKRGGKRECGRNNCRELKWTVNEWSSNGFHRAFSSCGTERESQAPATFLGYYPAFIRNLNVSVYIKLFNQKSGLFLIDVGNPNLVTNFFTVNSITIRHDHVEEDGTSRSR